MYSKTERTLDVYKRAGAAMRLFKEVFVRMYVAADKILPAAEADKLYRMQRQFDKICSDAEDRMFLEHRGLDYYYVFVFYGNLQDTPHNDVNAESIELARSLVKEIFKEK